MIMNILRVIPSMNPALGGPSQGIRNAIPELRKLKVHNEVVCLDEPGESFLKKESFPVHALGNSKGPWKYSSTLYPWLLENIGRFDSIIVHGLWLYHGYAVMKAVKQYRKLHGGKSEIKVYVMPHGMLDPWFQRAEGRKLKAIRNLIYWRFIEKNIVNDADGLLFTCQEELKLAKTTFRPYSPKRELNVGYGIAAPPVSSQGLIDGFRAFCQLGEDASYLLFISRIDKKKGVDLLLEAYLSLKNENALLPKLVIAGPGLETEYGVEMQKIAFTDKDIVFPGMLTGDLKWGAFYGAEAFILPSHQENFGISVAEALACGKPVLISNQINIWREISSGEGGFVADDTVEGVKYLLRKWTSFTSLQKMQMSENATEVYNKHFAIGPAALQFKNALL
jgi:glycosyltransferase involved in cell wall biosynthesis